MRSTLLSQAEIHALLYSDYNDSVDFDLSDNEAKGVDSDTPYSLSAHDDRYVESQQLAVSIVPKLYFPLEPMVVNCADPLTDRFAKVGITFQIREAKSAEDVNNLLPFLRSAILITLSQKTSEELLSRRGKESLASEILLEVGKVFDSTPNQTRAEPATSNKVISRLEKVQDGNPVVEVLFSSLIVH